MKRSIKALTFLACGLTPAAANDQAFSGRAELEKLDGVYASAAPEPWYGGHGTRTFSFSGGSWSLSFVHALDPAMRKKTFQFRTRGAYRVGAPSRAVPFAYDAVFDEEVKYVTLLTDDEAIVKAFGFDGCGLRLDVEIDISQNGCAGWKPVAQCGQDHDLLAISAAGLHFGVRPRDNDMCTPDKRPVALLAPVVKK